MKENTLNLGFCELVLILDMILNKCMTVEEKLNKSDFATVKNFLNMVLKGKRQATDWEKLLSTCISSKKQTNLVFRKHMFKFSKFHKISKPPTYK